MQTPGWWVYGGEVHELRSQGAHHRRDLRCGPAPGLVDLRRPGAENDRTEAGGIITRPAVVDVRGQREENDRTEPGASSPGPGWSMFAATGRKTTAPTRRHHRAGSE
jgi:hypothetical protein